MRSVPRMPPLSGRRAAHLVAPPVARIIGSGRGLTAPPALCYDYDKFIVRLYDLQAHPYRRGWAFLCALVTTRTAQPLRPPPPRTYSGESIPATEAGWVAALYRTLPPYVDDLTRDFGPDLYARMQTDPQVAADLRLIKMAVLADAVQLDLPDGVTPDDKARYTPATMIRAFCTYNLARLRPGLTPTLFALLDALAEGHKLAELVWEPGVPPPQPGVVYPPGPKVLLSAIKPKPSARYSLVVDPFNTLWGAVYIPVGQAAARWGQWTDLTQLPPNFVPRDSLVHLVWNALDNDPRGSSLLRAVYRAWWSKGQMWPGHLAALATFAQPSLWENLKREGLAPIPVYDADGTITGYTDPVTHALAQLQNLRNGSVGVGVDSTLQIIAPQGVGQAFEAAVDLYNREIATGLLGSSRATQEAQFGSKADSQTGQDVVGLLIAYIRGLVAETIRTDVLTPLVRRNFGADALALLPVVRLSAAEQQDRGVMMNAVAQLERAGWFTPSQKPAVDAQLGLPIRTPDEQTIESDRYKAPPIAPPPVGGANPGDPTADPAEEPPAPAKKGGGPPKKEAPHNGN
jgi:Protein of unknown function (DUF935)